MAEVLALLAALAVCVVIAGPCAVAWAWFVCVRPDEPLDQRCIGSMVTAASVEALVMVALGSASLLEPLFVVIAHALLVLVASAVVGAKWIRSPSVGADPHDPVVLVLLCASVAVGAAFTWLALVLPTSNFDSLAYHLPMLAHWVQSGALADLPHLGMHRFFPYGFEMWSLPLAVVLRSDVAAALPNLAGWALIGLAVHALARQAGAERVPAVAAAVVVLTAPVTLGRLDAIQPDLWVGATFVAGLTALVHARRSGTPHAWMVVWLAAGLMPFLKPSGFVFAGILGVAALALHLGDAERARPRIPGRSALAVAAFAMALASFWYLRNLVWIGNPLGEFEVRVAGTTWFDGVIGAEELRKTTVASAFRWTAREDWSTLGVMTERMLGLPLPGWFATGLLLAVWRWAHGGTRPPRLLLLMGALLLLCIVAYVQMPYGADNGNRGYRLTLWSAGAMRYALGAWALMGAIGAAGFPRGRIADAVAVIFALVAWERGATDLLGLTVMDGVAMLLISGIVAALVWRFARPPVRIGTGLAATACVVLGLTLAVHHAGPAREAAWPKVYGPLLGAIDSVLPPGAPVASYGLVRGYPLVGPRMTHAVTGMPHPWLDRRRWQEDPTLWAHEVRRWLRRLEREGVHHLVVYGVDRFPHRDRRATAMIDLLAEQTEWNLVRAPVAPDHLALYVWRGEMPAARLSP